VWSIDHGASGPCTGLSEWTTGPIELVVGANVITVRASDNAENESSVLVMVERVEPQAIDPPDAPTDPDDEEPVDVDDPPSSEDDDEPVDTGDSDDPIDTPDDTEDVDETPDPSPPESSSQDTTNPTGICGGIGAINLAATLLGICALRRRRVEAE